MARGGARSGSAFRDGAAPAYRVSEGDPASGAARRAAELEAAEALEHLGFVWKAQGTPSPGIPSLMDYGARAAAGRRRSRRRIAAPAIAVLYLAGDGRFDRTQPFQPGTAASVLGRERSSAAAGTSTLFEAGRRPPPSCSTGRAAREDRAAGLGRARRATTGWTRIGSGRRATSWPGWPARGFGRSRRRVFRLPGVGAGAGKAAVARGGVGGAREVETAADPAGRGSYAEAGSGAVAVERRQTAGRRAPFLLVLAGAGDFRKWKRFWRAEQVPMPAAGGGRRREEEALARMVGESIPFFVLVGTGGVGGSGAGGGAGPVTTAVPPASSRPGNRLRPLPGTKERRLLPAARAVGRRFGRRPVSGRGVRPGAARRRGRAGYRRGGRGAGSGSSGRRGGYRVGSRGFPA